MKSLKNQTENKIAEGRNKNPSFMKSVDEIIAKQKEFNKGKNAIKLESTAPNFNLPNPNGNSIELSTLLNEGPVVVTFYRGSWCPYCNLQLKALQNVIGEIHKYDAKLVAISPEIPDGSMTKVEINNLEFIVLSDQDSKVAKEYGVAWDVPDILQEHMRVDRKLDLDIINNGDGSILPIPATFVLDQKGKVVWRFIDVDYRKRSEPSDIIQVLQKLS